MSAPVPHYLPRRVNNPLRIVIPDPAWSPARASGTRSALPVGLANVVKRVVDGRVRGRGQPLGRFRWVMLPPGPADWRSGEAGPGRPSDGKAGGRGWRTRTPYPVGDVCSRALRPRRRTWLRTGARKFFARILSTDSSMLEDSPGRAFALKRRRVCTEIVSLI